MIEKLQCLITEHVYEEMEDGYDLCGWCLKLVSKA